MKGISIAKQRILIKLYVLFNFVANIDQLANSNYKLIIYGKGCSFMIKVVIPFTETQTLKTHQTKPKTGECRNCDQCTRKLKIFDISL